jgi:hypothetical protein
MVGKCSFALALAVGIAGAAPVAGAAVEAARANRFEPDTVFVVPPGEAIYGRLLMTDDEIAAYRTAVYPMTRAERVRFDRKHRARMDERAKERAFVFLVDDDVIGGPKLIPPGNGGAVGRGTSNGGSPRR